MSELIEVILVNLARLDARSVFDIIIVASVFYGLLVLMRGTTAMALLRGMVFVFFFALILSSLFQLTMLSWLLRLAAAASFLAFLVLFQPELRRALERVGRTRLRRSTDSSGAERLIDMLCRVSERLSQQRRGALMILERQTGLEYYVDSGIPLDALASVELLVGIFAPDSPLHDGAVILKEDRLMAAGCILPLSRARIAGMEPGTRHRAAIGITEGTDAISIVVSEETGDISVATHGRIVRRLSAGRLRGLLHRLYAVPTLQDISELGTERD